MASLTRTLNRKQHDLARQRRAEAIGFFQAQARQPGPAGRIGAFIADALEAIQKTPTLSSAQKEATFSWLIQRTREHGITTCPGCGRTIYLHGRTALRWTDHSFGGIHVCVVAGA